MLTQSARLIAQFRVQYLLKLRGRCYLISRARIRPLRFYRRLADTHDGSACQGSRGASLEELPALHAASPTRSFSSSCQMRGLGVAIAAMVAMGRPLSSLCVAVALLRMTTVSA